MTDLLLDDNYDLIIDSNNLSIGYSDYQHQALLLLTQKGELKENPTATIGIVTYLRDNDIAGMLHEVRSKFTDDGMKISSMSYDEVTGKLNYVANYKNQ